MKKFLSILIGILIIGVVSCKKEEFDLGDPPTKADAVFSSTPSDQTDNILNFSATRTDLRAVWDFGNGTSGQGSNATAIYPRKGTYTVTLTVFTKGGSAETSRDVIIIEDDFSLLSDPLFTMLTGGVDSTNGKTWVIDSATVGHFGVGPNPIDLTFGDTSNYYSAGVNEKVGAGFYDDRYKFNIEGFKFDMITKGIIYLNSKQASAFPGSYDPGVGDLSAPFPDQLNESWLLKFDAGEDTTLTVSGNSFLGYNTGVSTYKVIRLTENSMYLSYEDINDPALRWYIRLIPAGFKPSGGGGGTNPNATSLPLDFENDSPVFTTFGNSTAQYVSNPASTGINTSSTVLETVHGDDPTAGLFYDLATPLDFSSIKTIKSKVFAASTGVYRMKIENQNNPQESFEVDVNISATFAWVDLTFNFSTAPAGTYDRIVLFPGWNVANAGTFYLDDIRQE